MINSRIDLSSEELLVFSWLRQSAHDASKLNWPWLAIETSIELYLKEVLFKIDLMRKI